MDNNPRRLKSVLLALVGCAIAVILGLNIGNAHQAMAQFTGVRDRVIEIGDDPDFSLAGVNSSDLCLQETAEAANGVFLGCHNSSVFADLAEVSNESLRSQYGDYRNYANAKFFYQKRLGGRDSNRQVLNSDPAWHPIYDGRFEGNRAEKLFAGVTLMTEILKNRSIDLFVCANQKVTSQVPAHYTSPLESRPFIGIVDTPIFSDVADLMSDNTYIAIGAYRQSLEPERLSSGAFTYSQSLDRKGQFKLVAMSVNVFDLVQSSRSRIAGTIFHELLHNLGFNHNNNNPESYNDRGVAMLALEDCMAEFAQQSENAVGEIPQNRSWLAVDAKEQ